MFLVVSGCCRGAVGCCHGAVIVLLVVLLLVSVAGWHLEGWRLQLFGCFLRLSAGLAVVVHHFCGVFFLVFCCARGLVVAQVAFRDNSHMWLLLLVSFWGVLWFLLLVVFVVTVSASSAQLCCFLVGYFG